ncbi:FixH family protein [Sphingobium sp. H39-3-25]|uniref:FixH family protein n=1 Tax=Sphingobium arseniciresistens TaxID=3030834 RepID=UPI0023B90732|nr:FixH family protein [Sphingobium arseniciresistens]
MKHPMPQAPHATDASTPPSFRLKGWHVLGIFIAFFGVVIAVNVYMASVAVGSFGGIVVDNSYVASQEFNGWLKQARDQDALGWHQRIVREDDGHLRLTLNDEKGAPILGGIVSATAIHPLGRIDNIALRFVATAPGIYRSTVALPAGRWTVHWTITAQGHDKRLIEDVR